MRTTHKKRRKGFTLIELLTVVAIMGLLAAVLVPTIQGAFRKVQQNNAGQNLKSIVSAYLAYAKGGGRLKSIAEGSNPQQGQASSPAQYAEVLARYANLREAPIWYIQQDSRLDDQTIPAQVLQNGDDGANQLQGVSPISWAVVVNATRNPGSSDPLLWTRGLDTNGQWRDTAPWGKEGGHIAFGDGHVQWHQNLNMQGERLINRTTKQETSSYQEAIGETARVKEDT